MLMVEIRDLQRVIENLEIDDVFFAYREDETFVVETFAEYDFHKFIIGCLTSYENFSILIEDLIDGHEFFTSKKNLKKSYLFPLHLQISMI